jgi:hypothetical protein
MPAVVAGGRLERVELHPLPPRQDPSGEAR